MSALSVSKSKLGKTVFSDLDLAACTLDVATKRFKVGDGQTGVLRKDDRSSARKGCLERCDKLTLFRSFHC